MVEAKITIDLKGVTDPFARRSKIVEELEKINSGEHALIVSDDPKMEKLAQSMISSIGLAEVVNVTKEGDLVKILVKKA